jgi:hypothetical protein
MALTGVWILLLLRKMTGKAENPNVIVLRKSLGVSAELLQFVFIGAIAVASVQLSAHQEFLSRSTLFVLLSFSVYITFAVTDILLLREFEDTWLDIVHEQTEGNFVGNLLREGVDSAVGAIRSAVDGDPVSSREMMKMVFLTGMTLVLVVAVTTPIWLVLAGLFREWFTVLFIILALLSIRDLTRYIFQSYGAVREFDELSWGIDQEVSLLLVKGFVLAGALGYQPIRYLLFG